LRLLGVLGRVDDRSSSIGPIGVVSRRGDSDVVFLLPLPGGGAGILSLILLGEGAFDGPAPLDGLAARAGLPLLTGADGLDALPLASGLP
jgi:hypothetical protein